MFSSTILSTTSARLWTRPGAKAWWGELLSSNRNIHQYHHVSRIVSPTTTSIITPPFGSAKYMNVRTFASKTTGKVETPLAAGKQQPQPFLQNQEWIKFQQSIQVDGFQTGQMTKATVLLKKSKGGKQSRNRKAKELALLQQEQEARGGAGSSNLASSDNRFPAIRYSPQETQELLKLAYDTLPTKTGKRGTRQQKRQDQRWKQVRQIRKTYKQNIIAAHERKMEHRQWTRAQTKAVKEGAPDVYSKNIQYQATILQRWAATMYPAVAAGAGNNGTGTITSHESA